MTEEIIIDGVNVAGCCQLIEEPFYPCGLGGECKGWENCYYKQLKRLEQERDKLKTELHSKVEFIQEQRTIINEYAKEIEIYKQCQGKRASKREEELKQENKELKEMYRLSCLKCEYKNTKADVDKYRSALEEIREIITSAFAKQRPYKEDFAEIENIINKILNKG